MSTSPVSNKVPYFVLQLADGKARALFTVPTEIAPALVQNPIMCRGASFVLELDKVSNHHQGKKRSTTTTFLSTIFDSPLPEETAQAISERIAIRIGDPSPGMSQMFGFH